MMAPYLSGSQRGGGQPAQAALFQIVWLIQHLVTTQTCGVGFVWDTSVRTPLPIHVLYIMGPSTILHAPKCGSGAHHRPTQIWQNFLPQPELEATYKSHQVSYKTVDDILATAGLEEWRTSRSTDPTVKEQARTMLPRFGTRAITPLRTADGSPPSRGLILYEEHKPLSRWRLERSS
jgi:hypothetical protein